MAVGGLYCINVISSSCYHSYNEREMRFLDSWSLLGLIWKSCSADDVVGQTLSRETGRKMFLTQ